MTAAEYGILTASDVMVPMRDGTLLATDIHRPARDGAAVAGAFPTVLARTSYDKTNARLWVDSFVRFLTPRGYAVVVQDIRGRYRSEGDDYRHIFNPLEGEDGYDTIEWVADQPWCNGRIGMFGSSHGAIVQQTAAILAPPHLTAIWPDVGPTNLYASTAREGGAFALQLYGAISMHAYQDKHASPTAMAAIERGLRTTSQTISQLPLKKGQTALAQFPALEETFFEAYWRGAYDEWWDRPALNQEPHWGKHADVPATFSGGWWDPFAGEIVRYFQAMTAQGSHLQRLVLGPWGHGTMRNGGSVVGDADFGPEAAWGRERYQEEALRWAEYTLNDADDGISTEAPVQIFVMGGGGGHRTAAGNLFHGGAWRSEEAWPIARADHQTWYLQPDSGLGTDPVEDDGASASFQFDPERPVPSVGGNIASYCELIDTGIPSGQLEYVPWYTRMRDIVPAGGFHQAETPGLLGGQPPFGPLAARPDVLVFSTAPLTDDVEVTGTCVVRLWVSSETPDTDITAKLVDVYPPSEDYPDGYHLGLVDSILRLRFRNGWRTEELMTPGEVYPIEIPLAPTSNLFARGHRIRLDISSSNFPRFDTNPNTGEPLGRHTHTRVTRNTVHLSREHPSQVVLPVVPRP
ncbi:CocE/NonD family hydrolase [Nocardioides sp. LHG3406-4]|uniref:CocE/NonD family hydrolase n=1 Tax=Nocardioides sp. LHG3406-4 TaxID=2804575 RepID=UPI003CEBEE64